MHLGVIHHMFQNSELESKPTGGYQKLLVLTQEFSVTYYFILVTWGSPVLIPFDICYFILVTQKQVFEREKKDPKSHAPSPSLGSL